MRVDQTASLHKNKMILPIKENVLFDYCFLWVLCPERLIECTDLSFILLHLTLNFQFLYILRTDKTQVLYKYHKGSINLLNFYLSQIKQKLYDILNVKNFKT